MSNIRESLTPEQRSIEFKYTIDPGFIHHRKILTILGEKGRSIINDQIDRFPDLPDWQKNLQINRIYSATMIGFCNAIGIKPLGEILATFRGRMFCSTETLAPCGDISRVKRAVSEWLPHGSYDRRVEFHYSTEHITSSTLREVLCQGGQISIVAEQYSMDDQAIIFHPIIMGFPWLYSEEQVDFDFEWFRNSYYENFLEDFDEFKLVSTIKEPHSPEPMRNITEHAFKECLRELLGDTSSKDWGGETSDYFTAHLHLNGKRVTAAFLLKGPANFSPMALNHLGKKNDQIVRLAREPAQVLIIQHSHDIGPEVRETLRAFAVQPSNPRRYCLIDGRDSLRLLQAYKLYDRAIHLSNY